MYTDADDWQDFIHSVLMEKEIFISPKTGFHYIEKLDKQFKIVGNR